MPSNQQNIQFSPRAIQCVESYVNRYQGATVEDLCSLVVEQVISFERDYIDTSRWFRSQLVHEFDGFTCADKATGKPVIRQAFKLLKEDAELLVMAADEAVLPDQYYVERVIEEANFSEYQEYAALKLAIDKLKPPPNDT